MKAASCLPAWARGYFTEARDRYEEVEMSHRREAFFRLLCTDDEGMRQVWTHLDDAGFQYQEVLETLIYASDDVIEDTPVESVPMIPGTIDNRARRLSQVQNKARKLAIKLRELHNFMPWRLKKRTGHTLLCDIEMLCIYFDITLEPFDIDASRKKHNIDYTSSSKRGYIRHRRAADKVKAEAIKVARALVDSEIPSRPAAEISGLIADLEKWENFDMERGTSSLLRSQKAGWADWLRVAHEGLQWYDGDNSPANALTLSDWASLAQTLFGVEVSEERIRQIIRES